MLPDRVLEEHLDDGIKGLVLDLNRIPDVNTRTTCEGHVWRDYPNWPTKDGWVYFVKPNSDYLWLIQIIGGFCKDFCYFDLDGPEHYLVFNFIPYSLFTIKGRFESHEDGNLFDRLSEEEREAYYKRADARKIELLRGWSELDGRVVEGIRKNITKDVKSLPFRSFSLVLCK